MSKTTDLLILGLQITWTGMLLFCIYMLFALVDNDFGIDGIFGLLIIQPIMSIIFSATTILVCLIPGIPIRLNTKLNRWWRTHLYIPLLGMACGFMLLFLALLNDLSEIGMFVYVGWFMTAFSLLHLYPPKSLAEKLKIFLRSINR